METAAKVLIIGGVLNLALAFVIGFMLSNSRLKEPAKLQHYLNLDHKASLWEGFMLLGLVFAVELADLSSGLKSLAAALLVASSAFQDGSSVLNWLQGVADEFAERSPGFVLATINAILATVGLAILIVGDFRGL